MSYAVVDPACRSAWSLNFRPRSLTLRLGFAFDKRYLATVKTGSVVTTVNGSLANAQEDFTLPNLAGWVLAWVGLWYPLGAILFSSVVPKRENAVLTRLQDAEVVVNPI